MIHLWTAALVVTAAAAQYFPPIPGGLKVVESKHQKGVKISYKQVRFLPKFQLKYDMVIDIKKNLILMNCTAWDL